MKIIDVLSKKEFVQNGEKKTIWYKVGREKRLDNGGGFLMFFHEPNKEYYLVEPKEDKLPEIQIEE